MSSNPRLSALAHRPRGYRPDPSAVDGDRSSSAGRARLRLLLRRLLVTPAVLLAVLIPFSAAHAQVLDTSGAPGPVRSVTGSCTTLDAWGLVAIGTTAPVIYARNYTAGGGNDWADVRWRSVLFDAAGRQYSHGWSGFARAWDNAPASYSGAQSFHGSPMSSYRLRMEVQWWRGGQRLGAAWISTDAFTFYKGGSNYGVNYTGSCYYLRHR